MKPIYLIPFLAITLNVQAQTTEKNSETNLSDPPRMASKYSEENASTDENTVYKTTGLQVQPEFPGGIEAFYEFILANFNAPPIPDGPKTVKGYVSFVIEKDGSVSSIKVLKDPGYGTGDEAIRVLKLSPIWKPGIQNNKPVRAMFNLPLTLNLHKAEPQKKNKY